MIKYLISYASNKSTCPIEGAVKSEQGRTWEYETDDLVSLIKRLGDVVIYPPRDETDTWDITIYDDWL